MYRASLCNRRGWRVVFQTEGGIGPVDICGAINAAVAAETAYELNRFRGYLP